MLNTTHKIHRVAKMPRVKKQKFTYRKDENKLTRGSTIVVTTVTIIRTTEFLKC